MHKILKVGGQILIPALNSVVTHIEESKMVTMLFDVTKVEAHENNLYVASAICAKAGLILRTMTMTVHGGYKCEDTPFIRLIKKVQNLNDDNRMVCEEETDNDELTTGERVIEDNDDDISDVLTNNKMKIVEDDDTHGGSDEDLGKIIDDDDDSLTRVNDALVNGDGVSEPADINDWFNSLSKESENQQEPRK